LVAVPISDPNDYRHLNNGHYPRAASQPQGARYVIYEEWQRGAVEDVFRQAREPGYLPMEFVYKCIEELQAGRPVGMSLPPENVQYYRAHMTQRQIKDEAESADLARQSGHYFIGAVESLRLKLARKAACYKNLNGVIPFVRLSGNFRADEGIKGAFVFEGGEMDYREGTKRILNGQNIPIKGAFEDSVTGQWYELAYIPNPTIDPDMGL
jgi:hypothetical protein